MVAINNYSVSLSLEADDYIRKSSLSRSETARLRREIEGARTPVDKYDLSIRRLDKALAAGAISQSTYNRLLADQTSKMKAATSVATGLATKLAGVAAGFMGIHKAIGFVSEGLQTVASREQAEITLRVLTKSQDVAKSLVQQVRQFALTTPFNFDDVLTATKSFIAFGGASSEAMKSLRMFGDIAAGTGSNFGELVREISKMRSQVVIYSQDLNQITGRGINVLPGLAKRLGVAVGEVKKIAADGLITFDMLMETIEELHQTQFIGLMDEQSKSLTGRWQKFNEELIQTKAYLGEILIGFDKAGGQFAGSESLLQKFNQGLRVLSGGTINDIADAKIEAMKVEQRLNDLRIGRNMVGTGLGVATPEAGRPPSPGPLLKPREPASITMEQAFAFQRVGETIAVAVNGVSRAVFQAADQQIKFQEAVLAPSFEVGTQEAYKASIEAQNNAIKAANGTLEKKQERQVTLLESLNRTFDEVLQIWRESGPIKRVR